MRFWRISSARHRDMTVRFIAPGGTVTNAPMSPPPPPPSLLLLLML